CVHDAIAEKFPDLVFPERRGRRFWAWKMRAALWQATRVLTVSQASRDDIVRYLGVAPDRIDLTTEAANASFRPVSDTQAIARASIRFCASGCSFPDTSPTSA